MQVRRIGVVGIVIENPSQVSEKVNSIIGAHAKIILGRMGIPRIEHQIGVISLIVEGSNDEVGSLTGQLGNVAGVSVKSALTSRTVNKEGIND